MIFLIDRIKFLFQFDEKRERRFAHEFQHVVADLFGCDFQSAADMTAHQLLEIFVVTESPVRVFVGQKQIVADSGADCDFFDIRIPVNFLIKFYQIVMIGVEVLADIGLNASRADTFFAKRFVFPMPYIFAEGPPRSEMYPL